MKYIIAALASIVALRSLQPLVVEFYASVPLLQLKRNVLTVSLSLAHLLQYHRKNLVYTYFRHRRLSKCVCVCFINRKNVIVFRCCLLLLLVLSFE